MKLYESRLSYFHDKATINHCKPLSVHQHGGPSRLRHVETQTMQTADCRLQTVQAVQTVQTECYFFPCTQEPILNFLVKFLL